MKNDNKIFIPLFQQIAGAAVGAVPTMAGAENFIDVDQWLAAIFKGKEAHI